MPTRLCLVLPLAILTLGAEPTPPFNSWAQLVTFVIAVGVVVKWLWDFLKEGRRPNGTAGILALMNRMDRTLDQVVVQQAAATTALTGVTLALTRLIDRLENLPTRLELSQTAERNRHDTRNILTTLQAELLDAIKGRA